MIVKTDCFSPSDIEKNGNKFLIGNGSLGYRGTLEEFRKTELVALNMPGIYDTVPGKWTDSLNAPNPFYTFLEIPENEETLHPLHSQILSHTQGIILDEAVHFCETLRKLRQPYASWHGDGNNARKTCGNSNQYRHRQRSLGPIRSAPRKPGNRLFGRLFEIYL